MMKLEDLLSHSLWLDYTQRRYLPLDDVKYRLSRLDLSQALWPDLRAQIQKARKINGFYFHLMGKKFWFCQSACLYSKLQTVENQVRQLSSQFIYKLDEKDLFQNARVEEAISSAIYEGANSTRLQAKKIIATSKQPTDYNEHMLVNNYRALQWMQEHRRLPLSVDLICQLHKIITRDTLKKEDEDFAGRFRDDKVFIGPKEVPLAHPYVPPAMHEIVEQINLHIKKLKITKAQNDISTGIFSSEPWALLPPLVVASVLHYFIGYVHPFFDGNGRTARALFYFVCLKGGFDWVQLLSLSADLKNRGDKYEKSYDLADQFEGDLTYFIDFNLQSLINGLEKFEKKVKFIKSIENLKSTHNLNALQCTSLQKMVLNKHKAVDVLEFAAFINKSRELARQYLKQLVDKNLLIEQQQGKKNLYLVNSKQLKKLL